MTQTLRNRDRDDFTLRIVVTEPEPDEDGATTTPFKKTLHLGNLDAPPRALKPKPEPLSMDDYGRMLKRARAYQRIAWAKRMLRKFNFTPRT